ncbi:vWA domain-containing protein [Nocardioides alcanivorans]|uniref:vWA domain-containing protein n=1 Tax=Nocardioides alcanivorans TaxID=2897352 RepID=UPI001F3095EF|nr:VWA domain-containing protein [Nocardioides alcanivorans]
MTTHAPDEILLGFSRALRAAGVPVTQDRNLSFLVAATELGAGDPTHVRLAGHATLCAGPEDVARFDRVFDAWFNHREPALSAKEPPPAARTTIARLPDSESSGEGEEESDTIHALASDTEVLRHRDVAEMSPNEKHRLATMFATLRPRPPLRRTSRHRRWHRGEVDAHRTLRAMLRRMGEPGEIAHRRQARKPRRVVVLLDISGSMAAYAEAHLRLAHRIAQGGGPVEVFTVGTRLTRITRALRLRDPDRALAAAGDTVPDWSGGTRLGESLQAFLDRFGARGMARGAVVVLVSDGWERGDTTLLAEQMARLGRLAHRVVWVNPHRGKVGYEPVQQGVLAALPHVDDFLAGHSLATFAELMEVVGNA